MPRACFAILFLISCTTAVAATAAVSLTASPNPSIYGQPVSLTATVTAGATGKVTFSLNAPAGAITANAAIVPAGPNGAISLIATHTTNVIIDINGYFAPPGPGGMDFYPATPCRILDTRGAPGAFGAPLLAATAQREFTIAASGCVIPANAGAYSFNATVVPPAPLGFLSLWGGGGQPAVSTLNAGDGSIVADAALVSASNTGSVNVYASHQTHLILDINGYFQ